MPGPGRQRGHAAERAGEAGRQPRVEADPGADRFLGHAGGAALARRELPGRRGDPLDEAGRHLVVGVAHVEPQVDPGGDHVGPARDRGEPPDRRPGAIGRAGELADREHHRRRGHHRVAAVAHQRGARVVALALDGDPPAAVAEDGRPQADRGPAVDQAAALLDVQLDEGADAGQPLVVAAQVVRAEPGPPGRLGVADAVGVGQPAGPVGADRAGQQARGQAGDAEAGALLLREQRDRERAAGPQQAALAEQVVRGEGAGDAERAVEGAPAGHRVEVAAGHHGVGQRPGPARAPGPEPAVAIGLHVQ
jgi:hypothetical protein